MTGEFSISAEWVSAEEGAPEIRETAALVTISVGNHTATRAEDDWSKSVCTNVRVAAYPLALWLAASWWRLRWEPSFEGGRSGLSWRMAHETSAAGYGFIWPRLAFESDGENVDATCFPSTRVATEPLRYLETFRASVSGKNFERTIDDFISLVLARLETRGIRHSQLQRLWEELKYERENLDAANHRRIEAQLGFEPDEAPESLLNELIALATSVGDGAISEVAPACSGENPKAAFRQVVQLARSKGIEGKLAVPKSVSRLIGSREYKDGMPWERGRKLAHQARLACGLGDVRLSDRVLSEILEIDAKTLDNTDQALDHLPLGLAVRGERADRWKLFFRRKARTGRRFEAARLLGDHLVASVKDRWLPATDAKTVRQKIQRSFAAEFLCPIESLKNWLQGNYSPESLDEAGEYYGVSSLAIRSHLANHGLIPSAEVAL